MEVVVRTASGDAEITLGERLGAATVGMIVERVSGQPAPALLYVDSRAVPASTFLGDSSVRNGSVIDTREPMPDPPADAVIELVQIAGKGSGSRQWLSPGQYRLGPGRKVNAPELSIAPVERGVVDIDVDPSGGVLLLGRDGTARIDGRALPDDATTLWSAEWLDVAGRVFTYRRRADVAPQHVLPEPSATSGRVIFNRPPRRLPDAPPAALVLPSAEPVHGGFSNALRDFADRVRERRQDERSRQRALRHHMADAIHLAMRSDPLLWRVRPSHADAFHVPVAIADVPDVPAYERQGAPLPAAEALVRDPGALTLVPVTIDFGAEQGVGVVGDVDTNLAAARGILLQAVVEHGPADLDVVIATNTERRHTWEWVKWLPHARLDGHPNILTTADQVTGWADSTLAAHNRDHSEQRRTSSRLTIVVVDDVNWWRDRDTPLRPLLRDPDLPLRYIVLGNDASEVPAACTTIISTDGGTTGVVDHVAQGRRLERAYLFEVDESLAASAARALAALDDPDVPEADGTALPANVPLLPLHAIASGDDLAELDEQRSVRRHNEPDRLAAPIGVGANGTVQLDLTPPGTNVFIAGRRGAGTSELVRTIVLSFSLRFTPDELSFVLIDGLGGTTFRYLDTLPHVAGAPSGFDDHQAGRALRSLEAEIQRRRDSPDRPATPLLVVIHELAAALDVPDFGARLATIAEDGAALGVRIVASTRRPLATAMPSLPIEFSTRVALRLDDPADSVAAIASPDAAALPAIAGRGLLVAGEAPPVELQTATVITEPEADAADAFATNRVDVVPFVLGRELTSLERRLLWGRDERAASTINPDVRSLVGSIADASDHRTPVIVQPSLPIRLPFRRFVDEHAGDGVPFALADHPDEQSWQPEWWTPGTSISLIGARGSGATSMLITLALGIAERHSVDDAHVYIVASEPQWLTALAPLPHVGGVIGIDDPERIARLCAWVNDEIDRRSTAQSPPEPFPEIVVMIDGIDSVVTSLSAHPGLSATADTMRRILDEGPDHNVSCIVTASNERSMLSDRDDVVRLVAQLADEFAYAAAGVSHGLHESAPPGRAIRVSDQVELQVVEPPIPLHGAVTALLTDVGAGEVVRPPYRIEAYVGRPSSALVAGANSDAELAAGQLPLTIGRDRGTGRLVPLVLASQLPTLILGDSEAECTELMVAIAEAASGRSDDDLTVFSLGGTTSQLTASAAVDDAADPTQVRKWVNRIVAAPGRRLVLIDEAGRFTDTTISQLANDRDPDLFLVVAGTARDLRSPLHWLARFSTPDTAVLLSPGVADVEMLGLTLPDALRRPTTSARLTAPTHHDRPYLVADGDWTALAPIRPHDSDATGDDEAIDEGDDVEGECDDDIVSEAEEIESEEDNVEIDDTEDEDEDEDEGDA